MRKRIFAAWSASLFGIWYCEGALYAIRMLGLNSQT
jgi:predicted glycosyl hydrolase (DUF1957 family)